jgi:hypothetical protein
MKFLIKKNNRLVDNEQGLKRIFRTVQSFKKYSKKYINIDGKDIRIRKYKDHYVCNNKFDCPINYKFFITYDYPIVFKNQKKALTEEHQILSDDEYNYLMTNRIIEFGKEINVFERVFKQA